jgi:hypothetical protein
MRGTGDGFAWHFEALEAPVHWFQAISMGQMAASRVGEGEREALDHGPN